MNAGANKDDVKEKNKTFSWNDETKIFALREIVRAGAHLPKNLTSKRLTAAASCMQDYLFQYGPELGGSVPEMCYKLEGEMVGSSTQ